MQGPVATTADKFQISSVVFVPLLLIQILRESTHLAKPWSHVHPKPMKAKVQQTVLQKERGNL